MESPPARIDLQAARAQHAEQHGLAVRRQNSAANEESRGVPQSLVTHDAAKPNKLALEENSQSMSESQNRYGSVDPLGGDMDPDKKKVLKRYWTTDEVSATALMLSSLTRLSK